MISSPTQNRSYWLTLCCASVLGANLGDVLSRELGLGYWRGLPVLALLFGCLTAGARFAPRSTIWYWVAIIIVRAAATNLSDLQILTPGEPPTVRSPLSFPIVIAVWSIALACLALWDGRRSRDRTRTSTDLTFWGTMLAAGTVGTAVGDWLGFRSGLELPGATLLSTIVLIAGYPGLSGSAAVRAVAFWLLVALVRTWGTNVSDLLGDTLGLVPCTSLSVVVTMLAISSFKSQRTSQTA